ncbi:MAG: alpha-glucosidase [Psychroserpens sp.]
MKYILKIIFCISIIFLLQNCKKQTQHSISSPDTNICVTVLNENGKLTYEVTYKGKFVINPSKLGINFKNIEGLNKNLEIIEIKQKIIDEKWDQPWGEFKTVNNNYEEVVISLKEKEGEERLMNITFRVFNDGLGFRYEVPKQPNLDKVIISDELTEFIFSKENEVWWTPVHKENSYYESFYTKSKIAETDTINTPATFETKNGVYLAIHEANLTDYASMTLRKTSNKSYEAELVPWSNGDKVYAIAPFKSPWRTIAITDKLGDLATSTLMLNLNEPCAIEDTSWIEPSKYIGIWWGMHLEKYTWGQGDKHGATTANAKKYIDFASKHGFNGVLIEGWNIGWDGDWTADGTNFNFLESYPDFDIEEVSRYGASKNVRLIGHHETAGAVTHYESQMEDAFKLYHKNAVNAVKTGYVNKYLDGKEWHDGQFGVRHYRKVIETAAKYKIMIDNHEPVKGTGLQRTFPNLMTQEGARGQEYDAWSSDGGNPPAHTTIIPFTRMLAGPFDFTPGTFNFDYESTNKARVQTTLAKQLALYVVIFSPQQMASDLPENYEGVQAFEFIKQVPVIWSDTKVLDAKIGEFVVTARKDWNSNDWYIGAITNEEQRSLSIDLSFLDKEIQYTAEIYTDGKGASYKENPYPIEILTKNVSNKDNLKLLLAPGGGTAIKFTPK